MHIDKPGAPFGEGAGLVNDQHRGTRQSFEHGPALDQHAAPCRLAYAGNDGNRDRENERAWRGRNQHREHPQVFAGYHPCSACEKHGQSQEPQGKTISEPHHGRLRLLRRLNQAHNARIGALRCGANGDDVKGRVEAG